MPTTPPDGGSCSVSGLNCSVDDFDKMTADERIAWLTAFSRKYGYGDTFNSIMAVIEYFRDSGIIHFTPGRSYASLVDAAVLGAIQGGQRFLQGMRSLDSGVDAGANAWKNFFDYYHSSGGDWSKGNNELLHLYGLSEQAGETGGLAYADRTRARPTGEEGYVFAIFLAQGDAARTAQQNREFGPVTVPVGLPVRFYTLPLYDPRQGALVYAALITAQGLEASAYSQQYRQSPGLWGR